MNSIPFTENRPLPDFRLIIHFGVYSAKKPPVFPPAAVFLNRFLFKFFIFSPGLAFPAESVNFYAVSRRFKAMRHIQMFFIFRLQRYFDGKYFVAHQTNRMLHMIFPRIFVACETVRQGGRPEKESLFSQGLAISVICRKAQLGVFYTNRFVYIPCRNRLTVFQYF